jgi:ribosomal protein S27E
MSSRVCKYCAWYTDGYCESSYEEVNAYHPSCEEFEMGVSCPDCQHSLRLHGRNGWNQAWVECPVCHQRTDRYDSLDSALNAWLNGNTYHPDGWEV